MRVLGRYLAREVALGVGFVLAGFLALFTFFDLINELDDLGRGGYRIQHALAFVALGLPTRTYEILPIAALIGAIYALSQFAANSEFTAMRAAGMGRWLAVRAIGRIGIVLTVLTVLVGEVLMPPADRLAQTVRLSAMGTAIAGQFRSGMWIKDTVRNAAGEIESVRFVNVGRLLPDASMEQVQIFEFDADLYLRALLRVKEAAHHPEGGWLLAGVERVAFQADRGPEGLPLVQTRREALAELGWNSSIGPDILRVAMLQPERMSMPALINYLVHLSENRQDTDRYEIALWKKIVYPFAVLVMLLLALPFAYVQVRAGTVGLKVFAGIMLGITFHFLNGLSAHLGLLNTWPAWLAASLPSALALAVGFGLLAWVGRVR